MTLNRRTFAKGIAAAGLTTTSAWAKPIGANDDVRVAVVGLNGFGRRHIRAYQDIPGVRLAALCDVDSAVLDREMNKLAKTNVRVERYVDIRQLLDNKDIDAISVVTPNHWHALATIWACQAGKDVHVEKPISHNLDESRVMVAAARKYRRIVQAGIENRSSPSLHRATEFIRQGKLGKILVARAFVYKRRMPMGLLTKPRSVPKSVDYNLWCGPAPMRPLMRKQFHYDWHWQWDYGNGAIGNNGAHMLDKVRYALGNPKTLPTKVLSFGGRFGEPDNGETPDTQVVLFELDSVPVIYESRGLGATKGDPASDAYQAVAKNGVVMRFGEQNPRPKTGVMIQCEDGYVDLTPWGEYAAYDNDGREVANFTVKETGLEHDENFIGAVRSRNESDLNGDILEGHYSVALSHIGNIAHRVSKTSSPEEIRESLKGNDDALETLGRFEKHLQANEVDMRQTPPVLSPWLSIDAESERFKGTSADEANQLTSREYRQPFAVSEDEV